MNKIRSYTLNMTSEWRCKKCPISLGWRFIKKKHVNNYRKIYGMFFFFFVGIWTSKLQKVHWQLYEKRLWCIRKKFVLALKGCVFLNAKRWLHIFQKSCFQAKRFKTNFRRCKRLNDASRIPLPKIAREFLHATSRNVRFLASLRLPAVWPFSTSPHLYTRVYSTIGSH